MCWEFSSQGAPSFVIIMKIYLIMMMVTIVRVCSRQWNFRWWLSPNFSTHAIYTDFSRPAFNVGLSAKLSFQINGPWGYCNIFTRFLIICSSACNCQTYETGSVCTVLLVLCTVHSNGRFSADMVGLQNKKYVCSLKC